MHTHTHMNGCPHTHAYTLIQSICVSVTVGALGGLAYLQVLRLEEVLCDLARAAQAAVVAQHRRKERGQLGHS
jgi:hypothetical protein